MSKIKVEVTRDIIVMDLSQNVNIEPGEPQLVIKSALIQEKLECGDLRLVEEKKAAPAAAKAK